MVREWIIHGFQNMQNTVKYWNISQHHSFWRGYEISNIMAGVCLYSIHEFCGLNASHTVPESSIDMLLSLLDESMADKMRVYPNFIWIKSTFKINGKPGKNIPVYFILVLIIEFISKLKTAIQQARERMYGINA